jgi:hypothetical protein
VSDNFILIKKDKPSDSVTEKISQQTLNELLEKIGGINKVNISHIKDCFTSYTNCQEVTEGYLEDLSAKIALNSNE